MEIEAGIELETSAGMILYHVFDREMVVDRLKMIGQTVGATAKIEAFVFETETEIPFTGNEKTVVVTEIIIK